MPKVQLKLDRPGVRAVLLSPEVARAVNGRAQAVASNVHRRLSSGEVMDVHVNDHRSDRARSVVILAHPAALRSQAKHGTLTRAAAAAGLEVRAK